MGRLGPPIKSFSQECGVYDLPGLSSRVTYSSALEEPGLRTLNTAKTQNQKQT